MAGGVEAKIQRRTCIWNGARTLWDGLCGHGERELAHKPSVQGLGEKFSGHCMGSGKKEVSPKGQQQIKWEVGGVVFGRRGRDDSWSKRGEEQGRFFLHL